MRRVVITGAGTVNALGLNVPDTLQAMREGVCGIGPLDFTDVDRLSIRIGGQIHNWKPDLNPSEIALQDRATQFTLAAAEQAIAQSGLTFEDDLGARSGVILGTAGGGVGTWNDSYRAVYAEGKNRVHPFTVPRLMHNAGASHVSMRWGLRGPSFTVASACASSNHAMAQAFAMVRSGAAPAMVTGGAEAMLCFGGIKAWEGLRVLSPDACRPFCATRNGMVQGEGAGVFVFEAYDYARARGADILAEVAGCGMSSDAGDIVTPSRDGAARALRAALTDARLDPTDIGYINAHGTGTAANDRTETAAVREVFGPHADQLMISSTKAMHGHLIGGTGAVELLACIMALRDGTVAPTIGYQKPDPDCNLNVVPNTARSVPVRATLSTAFAFGGMNAVIALRAV